jgi:hypothetical protein
MLPFILIVRIYRELVMRNKEFTGWEGKLPG